MKAPQQIKYAMSKIRYQMVSDGKTKNIFQS